MVGYRLGDYQIICPDTNDNSIGEVDGDGCGMIIGSGNTLSGTRNLAVGSSNLISSGSDDCAVFGKSNNWEDTSSDRVMMAGFSNQVSGSAHSGIALGGNNTLANNYGIVMGSGNSNVGGGGYTVLAGRANVGTDSGYYSSMIAHSGTAANGYYQFITGIDASGNMQGGHTHSSGKFSSKGDAQYSIGCFGAQTTDATLTTLTAMNDFDETKPLVALNQTIYFKVDIVARRTSVQTESAAYEILGCIRNDAGSTSLVGSVTVLEIAESADWTVTAVANDTDDTLDIKVTGQAAKNINWLARVSAISTIGA